MHDQAGERTARIACGEEHDVSEVQIAGVARKHFDLVPRDQDRRHAFPRDGEPQPTAPPERFHSEFELGGRGAYVPTTPSFVLHRRKDSLRRVRLVLLARTTQENVIPVQPSPAFDFVSGGSKAQVFATASILRSTTIAGGSYPMRSPSVAGALES